MGDTVIVNVFKVGEDPEVLELPQGATFGDVAEKLGTSNAEIKNRGQEISDKADQPVGDGDSVTVAPKSVKAG